MNSMNSSASTGGESPHGPTNLKLSSQSTKATFIPEKIYQHALAGKKIFIINCNDAFADVDSILSACHTLSAAKRLAEIHPQAIIETGFISSDEFNKETLDNCHSLFQATGTGRELGQHYQQQVNEPNLSFTESTLPYRIQDAATVLFPLADHLNLPLVLLPGDVRPKQKEEYTLSETIKKVVENSNPYFGNFGKDLEEKDQNFIKRISQDQTFIELIQQKKEAGFKIYVLNGGSLTLLSELGDQRPDLAKHVNVLIAAFKQRNPTRPTDAYFPSHNESLHMGATQSFLRSAKNFKRVEIIDSNTSYYATMVDEKTKDVENFENYSKALNLHRILSQPAFANLIATEARHFQRYGSPQNRTKFSDSMMVGYLMGKVTLPMLTSNWRRHSEVYGEIMNANKKNDYNFCLIPNQEDGYPLALPYIEAGEFSGNPYSPFSSEEDPSSKAPQQALAQQLKQEMLEFIQQEAKFLHALKLEE